MFETMLKTNLFFNFLDDLVNFRFKLLGGVETLFNVVDRAYNSCVIAVKYLTDIGK